MNSGNVYFHDNGVDNENVNGYDIGNDNGMENDNGSGNG